RGISLTTTPFLWSGANSIIERYRASIKLAREIRRDRHLYPEAVQLIIAHSHGGNVALRALAQLAAAERLPFLVSLATPYLDVVPRDNSWNKTPQFYALVFMCMMMLFTTYIVPHATSVLTAVIAGMALYLVLPLLLALFLGLQPEAGPLFPK